MLETQVLCGKLVMENLATIDRKIPTVSDRTTAVAAALVSAPGDDRLPMATVGMGVHRKVSCPSWTKNTPARRTTQ
uniref:Uncharacterized protein n=1 Tax=Anopheles quadriannulatus TaxID=34691 RepID=A0A182XRU1_ANOQN